MYTWHVIIIQNLVLCCRGSFSAATFACRYIEISSTYPFEFSAFVERETLAKLPHVISSEKKQKKKKHRNRTIAPLNSCTSSFFLHFLLLLLSVEKQTMHHRTSLYSLSIINLLYWKVIRQHLFKLLTTYSSVFFFL